MGRNPHTFIYNFTLSYFMKNEILTSAAKNNLFLSPDALEYLVSAGYDFPFIRTLFSMVSKNKAILTKKDIEEFLSGDKGLMTSEKVIPSRVKKKGEIKVLPGTDITGNSTCEAKVEDFANYIRSRFNILSKIIEENHTECHYHLKISKAKTLMSEVCIIGMVYDVAKTKNGHLIVTIEDMEDTCSAFINREDELMNEPFVTDEVVGLLGKFTESGLFIIKQVFRPSVPKRHKWEESDSTASVAFISDIHVGSKEFIKSGWDNMTRWLKHNAMEQEINYVILAGDVVDGIGAYPGQEKDLAELSIYKQYDMLADCLKDIPDHIQILMQPGNHDACRLAEPQPALKDVYTHTIDSSVNITGNPVTVDIEGRIITSYHGKSFDDWIGAVRGMSYENPIPVMEHMIEKRHLAPIYGKKNALAPEKKDYLALQTLPDILITGHIHNLGVADYKGIKLLNSSTYQAQTDYQKSHNFNPVPCILPIVNLGTGRIVQKNFLK